MLEMTSDLKSGGPSENVKAQSEKNPTKAGQRMFAVRVDRVRERMAVLGFSPKQVTEMSGFARTYLLDLLSGKKEKMRAPAIESLAISLDCSVEFLRGQEDSPRSIAMSQGNEDGQLQGFKTEPNDRTLIEVGEVELGKFRLPREIGVPVTIAPEGDFVGARQCVFRISGRGLAQEGMPHGASIVCVNVMDAIKVRRSGLEEGHTVLVSTESDSHPGREFSVWNVVQGGSELTLSPLGHVADDREVYFGEKLSIEASGYRLSVRFLVTGTTVPFKK